MHFDAIYLLQLWGPGVNGFYICERRDGENGHRITRYRVFINKLKERSETKTKKLKRKKKLSTNRVAWPASKSTTYAKFNLCAVLFFLSSYERLHLFFSTLYSQLVDMIRHF